MTLTEYVLAVLERDDQVSSFDEWLAAHRTHPPAVTDVSVAAEIRAAREER